MIEEIEKIIKNHSEKVDWLGTSEESIRAEDGERLFDEEDIKKIALEIKKYHDETYGNMLDFAKNMYYQTYNQSPPEI